MKSCCVSALLGLVLIAPLWAEKPIAEPPEQAVVGYPQEYEVTPNLDGPESGRWTHMVHERDAGFLKVHFREFNLHPGDELRVFSGSGRLIETLTGQGPKNLGSFWSLSAFGETLILDLQTQQDYEQPPFVVDKVLVGDARMLEPADPLNQPESICQPADYDDVICHQGDAGKWSNIWASVGVMTVGNTGPTLWCSGSNVSPNNYLLTNQHCIETQAACDTSEFVFKYYRTDCNTGAVPTADWVSYRCDQVVAQSPYDGFCDPILTNLDFTLSTVIGDPAATFGYVEPDPTPVTSGEDIYIVQHPNGRPHEIAHGGGANVVVDGTTLRYYDTLDTEGGSSGSPIYREIDDKLIGLHHCGGCDTPGTGNRGMLMSDIYPLIEEFLCSPALSLGSAASDGLSEVLGNGNGMVEPAEIWEFTPKIRNSACTGDAENVTASLAVNSGSGAVTLLNSSLTFGTVAAGQTASANESIQFEVGPSACGSDLIFDLVGIATTSAPGPFADALAYVSETVGGTLYTTLFDEDFAGGIPVSWTVVDNGTGTGPAATWTTDDPGSRTLLDPPFAIVDSDELGSGLQMDEELISTTIDASGIFASVSLRFAYDFNYYDNATAEQCDVAVRSSATGGVWVNVANYSGADSSGTPTLDVTAQAAGDLQVRFHYYDATYEYWWAIDDVTVLGGEYVCESFDGELFSDGFESGDTTAWSN